MAKEKKELDLVIIGAGPAGLTAAIYAARADLHVVLLENDLVGGQVAASFSVENYPGFKTIRGGDLAQKMQEQAESLGAKIEEFDAVEQVFFSESEKTIETEQKIYQPKAVIIATGATPVRLPLADESSYAGKGIHYCAICDGAAYQGKTVAVVGGGNSAMQGALFLSRLVKQVILLRRNDKFNGEKVLLEKVRETQNIKLMDYYEVSGLMGQERIEGIKIKKLPTEEEQELSLHAVFAYIGNRPQTELFAEHIVCNQKGYIITNSSMQTNIPGVYAIGDVREKEVRQITTAVADGTIAALQVEKYLTKERWQ